MKTSLELFTGAGGLAFGLSRAGFRHVALVERDAAACQTVRHNQKAGVQPVVDWPLLEKDVSSIDFASHKGVDLLAGGPPCQPFAISGKRQAHGDDRNMFPTMLAAVRALQPPAVFIENVPGLLRGRLERYFDYVLLQLRFPTVERKRGEKWASHLIRLRHLSHRPLEGVTYDVHDLVLQAADFGVPQRRERVFIVAFRSDLRVKWDFPLPSHSLNALLWDQWVSGEYWKRHSVPPRLRPAIPPSYAKRVERLKKSGDRPPLQAWRTIRDAMIGLPLPVSKDQQPALPNHILVPGARVYPSHTGSPLDMPSKTLKAGAHGVPGGENILVTPDGAIRYFTIRECARLQTFPDDYAFLGTWKSLVRQVGNAVPVMLVERIASEIFRHLTERDARSAGPRESILAPMPITNSGAAIHVH